MTIQLHTGTGNTTATIHRHDSCPLRHFFPDLGCDLCCHPSLDGVELECPGSLPKECPLIQRPFYIKLSTTLQEIGDEMNKEEPDDHD